MENDKIVSLKARAYDILAFIQNAQAELQEVNRQLSEIISAEKAKKESEKVEEVKN